MNSAIRIEINPFCLLRFYCSAPALLVLFHNSPILPPTLHFHGWKANNFCLGRSSHSLLMVLKIKLSHTQRLPDFTDMVSIWPPWQNGLHSPWTENPAKAEMKWLSEPCKGSGPGQHQHPQTVVTPSVSTAHLYSSAFGPWAVVPHCSTPERREPSTKPSSTSVSAWETLKEVKLPYRKIWKKCNHGTQTCSYSSIYNL